MRPTTLLGLVLLATVLAVPEAAGAAPWTTLPQPWPTNVAVRDVAAFPPAGVALAGARSRVAVSLNGGATWLQRGPDVQGARDEINGLDFRDGSHGVVVGAGGLLLATSDGGRSWHSPPVAGGAPAGDLLDVDLAGLRGYAVGRNGVILRTTDGGETWARMPSPTTAAVICVATADGGVAAAATADGQLLIGNEGGWSVAGTSSEPATAVAAAPRAAWADAWPDLLAAAGSTLYGSTDGLSYGWSLQASAGPWPALAWTGVPSGEVLLAGLSGAVDSIDASSDQTSVTPRAATGVGDALAAAAPGGQSVAYVLGAAGRVARTLSGARPEGTLTDPPRSITAGRSFTLAATVRIAAPGTLVLQSKVPGDSWRTAQATAWTASSASESAFKVSPSLNTVYRLRFTYGGAGSLVTGVTSFVKVKPRVLPARPTYDLRRGAVYRFTGSVSPRLAGELVHLYTDRGGRWHKIELGGTVKVRADGTWRSRRFGTPTRETYRLQARVRATTRHMEAKSSVVRVTVR